MLTRRLVWVAVQDGEVRGVLVAFAAHGFFYPVRLCAKGLGGAHIYALLKKAFRDSFDRGYYFYVTCVDSSEIGKKFARMILARGGQAKPGGWLGGAVAPLLGIKPKATVEAEKAVEVVVC
jgi:hypothetical protein